MASTDSSALEKRMDEQLDQVVRLTKQNDELNARLTEFTDLAFLILACIAEYHTHEGTLSDYEFIKDHLPELEERLVPIVRNGFKSGKTYEEISTEVKKAEVKLIEILKRREINNERD